MLLVLRVAKQAGDHEALARAELDRRFGAAGGQRRDVEAVELDRAFVRQLADFRADAHRDAAVGKHDRREGEADAILLIFDGDRAVAPARPGSGIRRRRGSWRFRPTRRSGSARPACVTRPSFSARSSAADDVEAEQLAAERRASIRRSTILDGEAAGRVVIGVMSPRLATTNLLPPVESLVNRLTPICLSSERLTSAIVTLRLTCSGVAVRSRLTTCGALADVGLDQPLRFLDVGRARRRCRSAAPGCSSASPGCRPRASPAAASRRPSRCSGRPGRWPHRPPGRRGRWR